MHRTDRSPWVVLCVLGAWLLWLATHTGSTAPSAPVSLTQSFAPELQTMVAILVTQTAPTITPQPTPLVTATARIVVATLVPKPTPTAVTLCGQAKPGETCTRFAVSTPTNEVPWCNLATTTIYYPQDCRKPWSDTDGQEVVG